MVASEAPRHHELHLCVFFLMVELHARAVASISRSVDNIAAALTFLIVSRSGSIYFPGTYLDLESEYSLSDDEEEYDLRRSLSRSLDLPRIEVFL